MRMRAIVWVGTALGAVFFLGSEAAAQGGGGVGRSGMGQGEAQISTRSDVRLGIESGPGTSGERLQDMARAVSEKLGEIRECYGRVTAEDPSVVGVMKLRVSLPAGRGRVRIERTEDTVENRDIQRCVTRAFERASYAGVSRPANVFVQLDFGNTAAAGAADVARAREAGARVELTRDASGNLQASGGVPSREVSFTITGTSASTAESIAAVHGALRANIAGLLDCRRRAGRRDMDPEGELSYTLTIARNGRGRLREGPSTVQDTRAPTCVSRSLSRVAWGRDAAGRTQIRFRFAPRRALNIPGRRLLSG